MFLLDQPQTYREDIKKSRFLAYAWSVDTAEAALAHIQQASDPTATHNCWAYKLHQDYRFNDDGEPSGTAGKPILQAIEGLSLINTAVLVVRYFGGIKLGTGGLVRAYGGVASQCLRQATLMPYVPRCQIRCTCPFAMMDYLRSKISPDYIVDQQYDHSGVQWQLLIPCDEVEALKAIYTNLLRGQGQWQEQTP